MKSNKRKQSNCLGRVYVIEKLIIYEKNVLMVMIVVSSEELPLLDCLIEYYSLNDL